MTEEPSGDLGTQVYLKLINTASRTLSLELEPRIAILYLGQVKAEFQREFSKSVMNVSTEGLVSIENPHGENVRSYLVRVLFGLIQTFEDKHGVDPVWKALKDKFRQIYEQDLIAIKESNLEFPLLKHKVDYLISHNLFGFSVSSIRKKEWVTGYPLVTTKNLIFVPAKEKESSTDTDEGRVVVALTNILTLGREIYIGYEKRAVYGNVWVIDYKDKIGNTCCVLFAGERAFIEDFDRVISFARRELQTLTYNERKVLALVGQHYSHDQIEGALTLTENQLKNILYRLHELRCLDEKNEITAYGINTVSETPNL
ncbi:hypothetical protein ACFLRC_04890 [Candidatus Altiarchaeota archaeon]